MDNVILDVVIGLALVYATLALLAASIQEVLAGNLNRSRVNVMHRLLFEATGRDEGLKKRVLENPLITALSETRKAEQHRFLISNTGPSAVPPDLFARALLMEVDVSSASKPPSETHASPQQFIDALAAKGLDQDKAPTKPIVVALRGLLVGHETDWPGFENAVATWFIHIGDRSEGWYKRRSTKWTLAIAVLLAMAVNADTLHMARALSGDGELRASVATLAQRVVAQRQADDPAATPINAQAREPDRPEVQVSVRLVDAYNRLRPLYFRDLEIAGFQHRLRRVQRTCELATSFREGGEEERGEKLGNKFVSDANAWVEILPALLPPIEAAIAGYHMSDQSTETAKRAEVDRKHAASAAAEVQAKLKGAAQAKAQAAQAAQAAAAAEKLGTDKNSKVDMGAKSEKAQQAALDAALAASAAQAHATAASAALAESAAKAAGESTPAKVLESAHRCLIEVSAWVRAATTASKDAANQRLMQEAAQALEDSKSALLALVQQRGAPKAMRQLFLSAPQDFADCATDPSTTTPQALRRCVNDRQDAITRLPLGHTDYNHYQQFCRVVRDPPATAVRVTALASSAPQAVLTRASLGLLPNGPFDLCTDAVEAKPGLGFAGMRLVAAKGFPLLTWLAGIAITAAFILLGAPFWFDVLAKVVKVRAAGRQRDAEENIRKASGTLPLLPVGSATGAGALGAAKAVMPDGAAPTDPTLNAFEDQLTKREIMALQQRLDVVPASGVLDLTTRLKIKKELSELGLSDAAGLTPATYLALVGRPAAVGQPVLLAAAGRPRLRQPHPNAQALANNLMAMLQFDAPPRIAPTVSTFDDDLRALAVLYRFKNDPKLPTRNRAVFNQARNSPAVLDELDEALLNEILSSRTRKTPDWDRNPKPWMDWAIGELGQVEANANTRKASNPRVCEYLDELDSSFGDAGDHTPWCAAFVTWVIKRHNAKLPVGAAALSAPPASKPGLAASWATWGTGRGIGAVPQPGDVVVVNTSASATGKHVGWCFDADAAAGTVWLLGGNQTGGGRVCLVSFPLVDVVADGARF